MTKDDRRSYSFLVATKSMSERDALKLAKEQYSEGWWTENIITDIEEIGKLKAAEGLEVPHDEGDY